MSMATTETLTCGGCGLEWSRERVRGRKPTLCPDCTPERKPRHPGGRFRRPVVAVGEAGAEVRPLTPDERAERLMADLKAVRDNTSQADRAARLAAILEARDYGGKR